MAENKIELRSVNELLGMRFFIPSYQRGYRWTEQQVKDLLNDVKEFIDNKISDFYSLQPLVVKKRWPNDALDDIKAKTSVEEVESYINNCEWEVIDGQQRLTTIYIILYYLGNQEKLYSIEYATRKEFKGFLDAVMSGNKMAFEDCMNDCSDSTSRKDFDNIDYYHVFTTYRTIKEWFKDSNGKDKVDFREQLLKNIKFIWYESVEEDPIKVFTRLNIGKIKLTNSELIKALMLNRSNFDEESSRHIQLRQQEIASEWDTIEYTLQNDEFWLFLHKKEYEKPTRIDLIFDLICNDDGMEVFMNKDEKDKVIGNDEYRTFRYFYEYFHRKKNKFQKETKDDSSQKCPICGNKFQNEVKDDSAATLIKNCWKEVKRYYLAFQEWFNDLEMYHYVGFLVEQGVELSKILNYWQGEKTRFVKNLKETEIKNKIKNHTDLEEIYEVEHVENGNIKKGVNKGVCKSILLLHNIQTVINQSNINKDKYQHAVFYKFPFHLYKTEGWDVEHIDSNTENDLNDKASQNEFLLNIYYAVDDTTQRNIKKFINDPNATNFGDFKSWCNKHSNSLSFTEKNQIWNFTLLDSSTNRSYGNSIFSAKRRIILGKDRGVLLPIPKLVQKNGKSEMSLEKEKKANSAFIPPCTKHVFLKYYSPVSSDFNYWTRPDAKAYKQNIYDTLQEFGMTYDKNK